MTATFEYENSEVCGRRCEIASILVCCEEEEEEADGSEV